jgi:hypothetical protein
MHVDPRFKLFSGLQVKAAFDADNCSGLKKMLTSGAASLRRGMENVSASGTFEHLSGLIIIRAVVFSAMRTFKI